MDLELTGRVAIVAGGSRGIGRATALALAAEGCRVAIAARDAEQLEAARRAVEGEGAEALAVQADLTKARTPSALSRRPQALRAHRYSCHRDALLGGR